MPRRVWLAKSGNLPDGIRICDARTTYPSGGVTYGYNNSDAQTSMVDSTGTTTYTLDELYRPSSITTPGSNVVAYQYDAAGNRTRITYPDTKQVNYTFDGASRMDTVTDWASNVTDYAYDDVGRLTTTTLPNGVVQTSSYNNADQLTDIEAVKGGTTLTDFAYGLDNAGMRTSVVTPAGTESCTYDNLYRLTGVTYPDTGTQVYTYDAVGNRLTKVQGSTTSYTYDNADRMTAAGGVTYTYDNNGNQTGRGSDTYAWDIEDRLASATVGGTGVTYAYRGDDLRHSKTLGGVTTVYAWDLSAQLPVVLQEGNTSYVYGLGLISQTTGTTTSYPLADGLGSTAALTDASGAVTATYAYDVFGAVKSSTGPGSTEFRFAGQQDDPALGYQYLRARYYDPGTGRFLSKDPYSGVLALPQTQHSYQYSINNPVNFTDPTGELVFLLAIPLAVIAIAIVKAAVLTAAVYVTAKSVGIIANDVVEKTQSRPRPTQARAHSGDLPTTGDHPFVRPKKHKTFDDCWDRARRGFVDDKEELWQWDGVHGEHWDVQEKGAQGPGKYKKVTPDGKVLSTSSW